MRKMEEGPCHSFSSLSSGREGAVELKYRQSSSCEVLPGLYSALILSAHDLHITNPHDPVAAPGRGLRVVGFPFFGLVISSCLTAP